MLIAAHSGIDCDGRPACARRSAIIHRIKAPEINCMGGFFRFDFANPTNLDKIKAVLQGGSFLKPESTK
jgi:hypothetical protein